MRATLADASLARFAGRFVWLALDFDKPGNQNFVVSRGVPYTPTFYILDPINEHALATQLGAMTLAELSAFLERGEREMQPKLQPAAAVALARGDELLARNQPADAANAYSEDLRLSPPAGPEHERSAADLIFALSTSKQLQSCAETAVAEAPHMTRDEEFGRVVLHGLSCVDYGEPAPWAATARKKLEPLAVEAISLPSTVRDHRFKLYQELMGSAKDRGDTAALNKWGDKWLAELDATSPVNDDERSALDIARVDAASLLESPLRVLPALMASEKAMPSNYNASLRVAQMESNAKRYPDAIAACDRGLLHVTGPIGRAWLMQVKAEALQKMGNKKQARQVLQDALPVAREIGPEQIRKNTIKRLSDALMALDAGTS